MTNKSQFMTQFGQKTRTFFGPPCRFMAIAGITKDNQGEPAVWVLWAGPSDIYDLNRRIQTHYTNCFMHQRQRFFKGTVAIFCKSKKCILSNVDYRSGSKKSKFVITLISDSPFKRTIILVNLLAPKYVRQLY